MPSLSDFLDRFRSRPEQTNTHTAIGGPNVAGGSFSVPSTSYEDFLAAYAGDLARRPQNLTERPSLVFPVIADIDLQFDDPSESCRRRHDASFILHVAIAYANAIVSMRKDEDTRQIQVIVLHRDEPYVKSSGVVRDGLHILIPTCHLPRSGQSILRRRALPALQKALETLPDQVLPVEDSVDACYADNGANWQLYGSSKPGRRPYLVTHEVWLAPSIQTRKIGRACMRRPRRSVDDWSFWVRRLSVRSNAPDHMLDLNDSTQSELDRIEEDAADQQFQDVQSRVHPTAGRSVDDDEACPDTATTDADVDRARKATRMLAAWRADKYTEWRDVGFALRNTSDLLADEWHRFSARSEKYDRRVCQLFWDKMHARTDGRSLTLGSLIFWAREDNPDDQVEIEQEDIEPFLVAAIRNSNHTDWGTYMRKKMNNKLRSTPDSQNHAIYVFRASQHKWVLDEDGASIKCALKTEVVEDIKRVCAQYADDADFNKLCSKAEYNLKTRGFRDNVLVDIRESVSDPNFRELLDANPNLIGWTNGVFDLERGQFRPGDPEDFITMSCNHEWKPPDHTDYAEVAQEFEEFMSKLHTDPSLRDYCLDVAASSLSGKTIFEIMHTWTGSGSNGKTRMLNLLDMAMGDYFHTAPPSLLTGARPDSGRATPELCAAMGARMLVMSEVDGKATINVAVMKELSGGEKIATRELYKKATVMTPQFTMLLTCNDLSKIDSNDDGTWRRLKVLPFRSKFVLNTPQEGEFLADTDIERKMRAWAPYVMSMLQRRYPQAVKDMQAGDPPAIQREVRNYRAASDLDQDFLDKNMIEIPEGEIGQHEEADAWALLNTYRRESRESNITLAKLQEKLGRFKVPPAKDLDAGRKVFPGWRLISHTRT